MNVRDISERRFGRLTALYPTEERNRGNVVWMCKCDCGKQFRTTATSLLTNRTVSCGCLRKEKASITAKRGKNRSHLLSKTKIYSVWEKMKARCLNPKTHSYHNYGGRGISICEAWLEFEPFFEYVSKLPHFGEPGRSIDRINNDGNYEPGNVRWATSYEQVHNRRPCRRRKRGENGISA